jgi:hypothetical protein
MKRTAPKSTKAFRPRAAITSGAALGLVVGAAVYGAVSSSADAPVAQTLPAKPPVTVAPVVAEGCTGAAKLEAGFCVVHVVRTVIAPPAAAPAAPVPSTVPSSTLKPVAQPVAKPVVVPKKAAIPAVPAKAPVAAVAPAPRPSPTTAPAPGTNPSPTPTPVPTAAS